MKKILTSLMLFTASFMLLFTTNNVFAVEYDDLFYTTGEVIEITVLSNDNLNSSSFQDLIDALGEVESSDNYLIDGYYNDIPTTFSIFSISSGSSTATIRIPDRPDFDLYLYKLEGDIIYINYGSDLAEIGDVIKLTITEPQLKSWTQAHDYGRIRLEDTTKNMYLNKVDNEVFLSTTSPDNPNPENHKAFLDQPYVNDKNFEVGTKVTLQSPYENFKIIHGSAGENVIVQKDNVSAVYLEKVAQPTSTERIYDITVFYWEDEELLSQVVEDVDLFGLVHLRIMFYGDIRKAIDYQDVMVANVDDLVPLNDFLQYLTAFDPIDGDISDQITVLDDGGYLPEQVGVYNVEFEVTNSQEQQTTIIIPIHVVDIVAPVITGSTDVVNISYDQTFNVTNWVNSLTVTDNYYTGLSISIKENTYTVNKSVIGTYHITVEAVDPSGNKGTLTRTINVTDGIGPVFDGINTITASINENLTAEQIKAGLAAVDAIDGNVTSSITIDSDGLLGNQNTPGTYQVVFRAEDLTGNHTLHTVEVTIVSSPPGFYILNSNSVRLLPGADLTIEQILTLLGVPGATEISTNYDASKPGTYNLSFTFGGEVHTLSITVLGQNDAPIPTPTVPDDQQTNTRLIIIILVTAAAVSLIGYTLVRKYKK